MAKTLAAAVHLTDDSGITHTFLPGSTPPKWARKRIDNPKAWSEDDGAPEPTDADDAAAEQARADEAARAAADAASQEAAAAAAAEQERADAAAAEAAAAVEKAGTADAAAAIVDDVPIPAGNASTKVWAEYASKKGFDVDPDVSRGDIITTLKANGVPTER